MVYPPEANDKSILKAILAENPDLVGFSTYHWNIKRSLRVAERVESILPETKAILGE